MRLEDVKELVDAPEFPFNRDEDYEAWKDARFDFVGSSTIAAILGLNKYETALQTWSHYIARESTYRENDYTFTGHHMESHIQQLVERQHEKYRIVPYNVSHISRGFPFASATPDGIIFSKDRTEPGVNEVKFTSARADLDIWDSGEVPAWVMAQAQWQCGVCGLTWGLISAMVQGNVNIKVKEFDFDPVFFAHAIKEAQAFLRAVHENVPFKPSTAEEDNKILDRLMNIDPEATTDLPPAYGTWLPQEYLDVKADITSVNRELKALNSRKRELERKLKDSCNGAGVVKYDGGRFKISEVKVAERFTPGFSYYRVTHKKG